MPPAKIPSVVTMTAIFADFTTKIFEIRSKAPTRRDFWLHWFRLQFSFFLYRCKKSLFARFIILMHKRVLCHNLDRAASGTRYTIPIQNVCLDKENLHLQEHKPYHDSPNKRKIAHKRMKNFIWYNSRSFHSLSHSSSYVKQTGNYLTLRGSLAYDSIAYHRQGHNWKSCHTMAVVLSNCHDLPWWKGASLNTSCSQHRHL